MIKKGSGCAIKVGLGLKIFVFFIVPSLLLNFAFLHVIFYFFISKVRNVLGAFIRYTGQNKEENTR